MSSSSPLSWNAFPHLLRRRSRLGECLCQGAHALAVFLQSVFFSPKPNVRIRRYGTFRAQKPARYVPRGLTRLHGHRFTQRNDGKQNVLHQRNSPFEGPILHLSKYSVVLGSILSRHWPSLFSLLLWTEAVPVLPPSFFSPRPTLYHHFAE